ncbi:M48 family metallopeptidase [Aliarcobacter butzleri]|uniref:M48 family metallopeptidase n=1 Tax=Aliarcobacter butzleri TaxID=28197 RepID=UPI00125F3D3C|nr:M48 family metallopeptidase [Aliarcobacter butzleri]MCT7549478.1 M48 family metallopeptidase [Aliarcobacter butzleri]MCT7558196.1 M48 family metallopeptidase [Aliarcobacter butzleri]MCT7625438.1 M48 family metallopeptidase [Aliarcobacter butzleri]MCT7636019.1 M48 family metallopeptidase [Aliarcobacter butzleri]MCT7642482.1 M48 family metallopeptidase [Aliarcobacter butzleri]
MSFQIELNEKQVTVKLVNKKNVKHCYIRVLKDDLIEIKSNIYFSLYDAKILVEKRKNWLENAIKKVSKNALLEDEFLYLGEVKKLQDYNIKNLDKFYKNEIEKILPNIVETFSKKMDLYPTSISYRKNKRTWGSCNFKNGLNFNILLIKFPLEIMQYVVIHELSHIKHKNHSKNFWNLVEKYCPNYKQIEKEFKNFL